MARLIDPSESVSALFGSLPKPADELMSDVYLQQHLTLSRQLLPLGAVNILAGVVVAGNLVPEFGWLHTLLWCSVVILFGAFQIRLWLAKRYAELPEWVSGDTLRRAEWICLGAGVYWGSLPFIFMLNGTSELFMFVNFIQCGMAIGLVSMLPALPRHVVRFMLPCIVPGALLTFFKGNIPSISLAVMILVLAALLVHRTIDNYKQLRKGSARNLESRQARNNLIDAIESTNDAFALFDADKQIVLMNERHKSLFGEAYSQASKAPDQAGVRTISHEGRWLLQSSHKTLDGGFVIVHTDVTALKSRQRELLLARREAEEADLSKTRFLSTMSHELRTPLNLILSFSRLMASDSKVELNWDEVADYADNIRESGAHLLKLIDDIIDYSKIGLDKMFLSTSDVGVEDFITRTVSLAASFENWRDLSNIDISVSADLRSLRIDETICQRILMNLIGNAMRFSGETQRLVIRAGFTTDGSPFIAVRDFGRGMSEDDLEQVFDAFYQCKGNENIGHGGAGLGLTLSRQLAHIHDGEIILKSRVGVGTTAMLILPASTHLSHQFDGDDESHLEDVA